MKKIGNFVLGTVFLSILIAGPVWADGNWKEVKNRKGIRIETRKIEGSPMKEFRSERIVKAPIEVVYEVVRDASTYVNWFGDCAEKKVVQKIDENTEIGYQVVDIPFPLSDRDTVSLVKYSKDWDTGKVVITMNSIGIPEDAKYGMDEYTKEKRRVRMPVMNGIITLTRIDTQNTKMIYQAHAEPGITLPAWVLNGLSTGQPFKTLKGIVKEVQKEVYYQRAEKTHGKKFVM